MNTYTYDPLDRTTSKTEKEGTTSAKTTTYSYLGLSGEVLDEEVAGKLTKSFQYAPWGERLSQVKIKTDSSEESSYYGYNPHTDVEQITKETGDTRATYGYTAYGKNDDKLFTGVDKPDPVDPTAKEEYNPYRFNAKRWDNSTGMYDMGFRDYNPNLNRFLNLDTYNDALDDLALSLDPWTANRYAFAGGNPISNIEIDGHDFWDDLSRAAAFGADPGSAGSILAHGAETAAGLAAMVWGAGSAIGGGAACLTGVGCIVGAPAVAAGAGVITAGAATAGVGTSGLINDIRHIVQAAVGEGSDSSSNNTNRSSSSSTGNGEVAKSKGQLAQESGDEYERFLWNKFGHEGGFKGVFEFDRGGAAGVRSLVTLSDG
ncbi:tRNA nuclease WapA precursor [Nonomuraea coxensis DSM 45129]|uniref:tRNA nuclease WapA n=1 Tax=Nonomuraea coxensis DSM 45129 TaxID=1122611 RepID=A0ABX8UDE3_9ACTN|nr:RHS repeat-associated core domain-containing protein [Nonomuraea coxensis]QYC45476.1 tRNA nuclease WapA precursor [Nonomuraea coxensis DSM 45129]